MKPVILLIGGDGCGGAHLPNRARSHHRHVIIAWPSFHPSKYLQKYLDNIPYQVSQYNQLLMKYGLKLPSTQPPTTNTMVLLVTTTHIISALEAVPSSSRKELDLPDSLSIDSPISHEQVIRLSRYFRNAGNSTSSAPTPDRSLNSLLRGTKVYVPPPKKPEPVRSPLFFPSVHQVLTKMMTRVPSTSP